MGLALRNVGAWYSPASGKVAIRWNGGWQFGSGAYIKGAGAWRDSGYRGYPAAPSMPWVTSWSPSRINVEVSPQAGGAPVSAYHWVLADSNGNWLNSAEGWNTYWWDVNWQTYYQIYCRTKSASGLYSVWNGPLKVVTGRPSEYYETTETANRYWQTGDFWCNAWKDNGSYATAYIPSNVFIENVHWQLHATFATGTLSGHGATNRWIYLWSNESEPWGPFQWPNPLDGWDYLGWWSNGGRTGISPHGSGWSVHGDGGWRIEGWINVTGTEQYQYQQGRWTAEIPNGYW